VGNVPHHCELFSVLTIHRPLKGINRGGFLRNSNCHSGKKPLLARRTTVGSTFVYDQVFRLSRLMPIVLTEFGALGIE
jgi:hypothetical protein